MKVKLEKEYKKLYTILDIKKAKKVIEYEKNNDEWTAEEWAEYAFREGLSANDSLLEIIKAEATTAKNCRVWNVYEEDTENMDVWISAIAETVLGFIKIGAYLSDIWNTGSVPYKKHMFIKYAKKSNI